MKFLCALFTISILALPSADAQIPTFNITESSESLFTTIPGAVITKANATFETWTIDLTPSTYSFNTNGATFFSILEPTGEKGSNIFQITSSKSAVWRSDLGTFPSGNDSLATKTLNSSLLDVNGATNLLVISDVPEPTTMALMSVALVACVITLQVRRRVKTTSAP